MSVFPQITLCTFLKPVILEEMGMRTKSDIKMTFNVYKEIKEI